MGSWLRDLRTGRSQSLHVQCCCSHSVSEEADRTHASDLKSCLWALHLHDPNTRRQGDGREEDGFLIAVWLGDRVVLVHAFQQRGRTRSVFFSVFLPMRVCYRTPDVVPCAAAGPFWLSPWCVSANPDWEFTPLPPTSPVVAVSLLSWSVSLLLFHK